MRVLLSGYVCDPASGSEAANTWYTARELVAAGARVHLVTRAREAPNVRLAIDDTPGLDVTFLSDDAPYGRGQVGVYARYMAFQRRVHLWARHNRGWDVAHHVSWGSLTHPVGLAGICAPLVVGPVGGGQPLRSDLAQYVDGPTRWHTVRNVVIGPAARANPFARRTCSGAALVLATNWASLMLARRLGATHAELGLAEGVRAMPAPAAFPAAPTVVWIGRFLPIKAAGLALAAFRKVRDQVPDATLEFVGDGPTRDLVARDAADLVARGAVRFSGALAWSEAQARLARARVHLFTSVRDSSSAQALEAAALGVPTVGLGLGGLADFWSADAAVLVAPSPAPTLPERIAAATVDALTWDEPEWLRRSSGARAFAAGQLYSRRAEGLLAAYEGLLR